MHAAYAIARALELLGMKQWTHTVLMWLGNYDGFEQHIPPADDPVVAVRDLLIGYLTRPTKVDVGQIHVDICQLAVLHHRAAWINERTKRHRNWMPLRDAWLDFVSHGEDDEQLRVWWSETEWPPKEQVRRHLLEGYVRMNSGSR